MYLADGDACRSNLSLCVCDIYDFDPVLPISGMQETTHWAHWYSQWLPQILTGRLCQSTFSQSSSPPTFPHHFRYLFVKHFIMQVGNYYTGISTSCSACTSVGTVSGNASQVTYTMDTQISISLLNIRTRYWSSQEEVGKIKRISNFNWSNLDFCISGVCDFESFLGKGGGGSDPEHEQLV